MSTPKNNFKQEDNFFGIQHTQGDSMALVLSILRVKHTKVPYNIQPLKIKKNLRKIGTAHSTKGYAAKLF